MAEVLGTVIGVVSLGLQVCSGVIKYLDGIKGHRDDIASASRLCRSFQGRLSRMQAMQDAITGAVNGNGLVIDEAISSVKAELANLSAFLDTVRPSDEPSNSFLEWIKERKARVTFPFRREYLDRLQGHLEKADRALQAALQIEELQMAVSSANAIHSIETKLAACDTNSNLKLDGIFQQAGRNHQDMGVLLSDVSRMSLVLETLVPDTQHSFSRIQNQLEEVLRALNSSDPDVMLKRVLSKPDVLRMICQEATINRQSVETANSQHDIKHNTDRENQESNDHSCRCTRRRMRKKLQQVFGSTYFSVEHYVDRPHAPDCSFAGIGKSKKVWSFGMSGELLKTILGTAITISMHTPFGAGGFSLSTSFTTYFVRETSPALDVIQVMRNAFVLNSGDFALILDKGIETLRWIFKTSKASPNDVSPSYHNLLHAACFPWEGEDVRHVERMRPLFDFLVASGVPRDRPDRNGSIPVHHLFWWLASVAPLKSRLNYGSIDFLAVYPQVLMPDHYDIYASRYYEGYLPFFQKLLRETPKTIGCFGDNLHTAIVQRDLKTMTKLLERNPKGINFTDPNTFGITALELLTSWPAGLDLVSHYLGNQVLQTDDNGQYSVLFYAVLQSMYLCSQRGDFRCRKTCSCTQIVIQLLDLNCSMKIGYRLVHCMAISSLRCKDVVISHLALRRRELMQIALRELSPSDIKEFGFSGETVLDSRTREVVEALERCNVQIPRWLRTEYAERSSIYNLICESSADDDVHLLRIAYGNGFKEIDTPNARGRTPLMTTERLFTFLSLVGLGGDPLAQIPGSVAGYTAISRIFSCSECLEVDPEAFWTSIRRSAKVSRDTSLEDQCRCNCSVNGCHPLTILAKTVLSNSLYPKKRSLATRLKVLMADSEEFWSLDSSSMAIVIRVATFERLSIRHTCCSEEGLARNIDEQEMQDLHDEDALRIKYLEDLVPEFEAAFEAAFEKMACDVSEFFETYWKDRMSEVLDELERMPLTEENLQGIENLGIKLKFEDDESSVGSETPSVGHFMEQLDRIADGLGT